MKWLSFLIFVSLGLGLIHTSAICAGPKTSVEVQSIVFGPEKEEEKIAFQLSGPLDPKIFFIKGDRPRLVVDFYNGFFKRKNVVSVKGGQFVTAIRTGMHVSPKKKLRVVIDLTSEIPVQFTKDYSENLNLLVVTIKPVATVKPVASKEKKEVPQRSEQQPQLERKLPPQEELEAKPLDEKPIPPVFATQKTEETVVAETGEGGEIGIETPKILDITFDNTSNRGEMVLFRLNDFYPPVVSAMEKETPRVICEFMDMDISADIQASISTHGKYVQQIKTTKENQPDKVRIVLELSPDIDYDLQQVFFKNDNLFVLIINELIPETDVQQ